MTAEDKERIEKESKNHASVHSNIEMMVQDMFIQGAEYERTIADQQLAEKDKDIENRKDAHINTITEKNKRISELEEALRRARGYIGVYMITVPPELNDRLEEAKALFEHTDQLLK